MMMMMMILRIVPLLWCLDDDYTDDDKSNDNYAAIADNYDSYDDNDELMRGIIKIALIDFEVLEMYSTCKLIKLWGKTARSFCG